MPEIESEVTFEVVTDKVVLHTMTDGDTLVLNGLELTKEQAATLSWLINYPTETVLEVQVKLKGE